MSTATKKCPFCAEEVQFEAIKCRHCGSWIEPPSPSQAAPHTGYGPPTSPYDPTPATGFGSKRLTRSSRDRMLSGVCGGIGAYIGLDATWVRILFAVGTLFSAILPGVILYIILAFVVPSDVAIPPGTH